LNLVHREIVSAERSDAPGPAARFVIGLLEVPAQDRVIGRKSRNRRKQPQDWTSAASDLPYSKRQPEAPVRATDRYRPRPGALIVMMTMEKAQKIIEAGVVKAKEIGQPMNIAVVDVGANLTAFARMDGAWLGSIDIAINKAFTAKAFDISTLELGRNSQPGDQFFGIHVSNHARVMIFAGGIPIKMKGQIVGAVGVSGGSGEQDQAVAEAVVAAWS
jgi:uncharacterized protein GlcG (DUF336 family)